MEIANGIMKDAEYPVDADANLIHPLDSQFKSLDLEEATLSKFYPDILLGL